MFKNCVLNASVDTRKWIKASVVRAVKKAFSNKYAIIFASSVVCYGAQSIVNIDQPITTPLFILMLALTESECRAIKQE